jgi:hypothetical protein
MDNLNYENLNLINQMYTKISDINTKNNNQQNYSNYNHDNSQITNNNLYNQNSNQCSNNYQNNNNLYNTENFNNTDTNNIDNNNFNSSYNNLSYLLYEEPTKTVNKRKTKKTNKTPNIKLYVCMFILFYILNTYYVIKLFESQRINYKLSLIIRTSIFMSLFYILQKYIFT